MSLWIAVLLSGLMSAVLRVAFVAGNRRVPIPGWFDDASRHIGPAFTAAVIAASVFTDGRRPFFGPDSLALVVAAPIALRTRSIPLTLAVGLPAAWLFRALW
jgi:branched-subunit amino acid transport protein